VEGTHLSPQAHERLKEELAWRSGEHRQEISQWIERAREHGDIRENADYDAAKNEQGHNEARVRQLESILRTAVIVDDAAGDVVAPGVVVEIKMDGDDEAIEYLVGSIEERHETYPVLSVSSPLGQALLGAEVGAEVSYELKNRSGQTRTMSVSVAIRPSEGAARAHGCTAVIDRHHLDDGDRRRRVARRTLGAPDGRAKRVDGSQPSERPRSTRARGCGRSERSESTEQPSERPQSTRARRTSPDPRERAKP
jgi:transcription elongation factor GreA